MLPYLIIFELALILLFIYPSNTRNSRTVFAILWYAIALFVGFGDMLGGYDRYIYGELFDSLADDMSSGGSIYDTTAYHHFRGEDGFVFLNFLISTITHNRYIFIFIITITIYILAYRTFSKYSRNLFFTLILFLGLIFFFSFTYLRQILAAAIIWQSIKFITERKLLKFTIVILIAFSIHNSALIFFPIYFIPIRKFKIRTIITIAIICLCIGIAGFHVELFETYGQLSENEFRSNLYKNDSAGFRIEYLMEAIFFLTAILIFYNHIPNKKSDIVFLNMGIIFCFLLLIFIKSLNGGRLGWFYMIGIIITLTTLSNEKSIKKKIWYNFGIILISFLLFIRILLSWPALYPYKTFFTPGHVEDVRYRIYDKYEYDFNYDQDKFYR